MSLLMFRVCMRVKKLSSLIKPCNVSLSLTKLYLGKLMCRYYYFFFFYQSCSRKILGMYERSVWFKLEEFLETYDR